MERYSSGLYEAAARSFLQFRLEWPDHPSAPEALFYQAGSVLGSGRQEEAIDLFGQFRDLHPLHPLASEARLTLGSFFFEQQDYERAIESLGQVVEDEITPETAAKALFWMGMSASSQGDFSTATSYYQRAADEYPDTETAPLALYSIGLGSIDREDYSAAARAFEQLSTRYPRSEYVQAMGLALAEAYYETGDYARAIEEIDRRLSQLPEDARERATFLMAESYNQLRDSRNAIVYYRRFTEDNPDSPFYRVALYGLGWNYHFEGVYEWAAEQFELAQEGHSDLLAHRARFQQGVNLALAVQHEKAVVAFEDVIARWPQGERTPDAWFELGMARYQLRRWNEAAQAFSVYASQYRDGPRFGEASRMLGEAYVATGDFDGAFDAYNDALAADAAPPELRDQVAFQKAWLLYRSGRYDEAAPAFMAIYRLDPTGPHGGDALFWAAESHFQSGAYARATSLFTQFLREYQAHRHVTAAHYALGWSYFRDRQYAGASLEFQRFLSQYQGDPGLELYARDARLRLADSFYAMKQYGEAVRAYRRVVGDERDYALFQIGQALANSERIPEALAAYEELRTKHPFSQWREEASYQMAYLAFLEQEYDRAIEEYTAIIERNPDSDLAARAQYGIGDAYYNAGEWEQAEEAYALVLQTYPESELIIDAVGGLQYALIAQEKDEQADQVVDQFAEEHPTSPILDELRLSQAELTFRSGDLEKAIVQLHVFLQSAQTQEFHPDALNYLGQAHADLGRPDSAVVYLQEVAEKYPNHPLSIDAAQRLGTIYLDRDEFGRSLRLYRSLQARAGSNDIARTEATYGYGMSLLGLGRTNDAEQLFQEILREEPSAYATVRAQLGLARVYDVSGRPGDAAGFYRLVVRDSQGEAGAEALCRLGELLVQTGSPQDALSELSRLPVLYPSFAEWQARGYLAQARAYLALDQVGEASRIYDIIITRYPDTRYAGLAQREKNVL
jgi:TolA-binding protein